MVLTMMRALYISAISVALLAAAARGADPTTASSAAAPSGNLRIVITAVQGPAEALATPDGQWEKAKEKLELPEGCQIRTGPKGTVQFTVGTDTIYRVDRLSLVEVTRARLRPDGTINMDLGMTYGRVSKDLDAPVRPHDDTIVTPGSTLAVRGTRVSVYDQPPYTPEAVSLTGRAVFVNVKRQTTVFGDKGQGTAKVSSDLPDAASNALANRIIDPSIANARTAAENQLLAQIIARGGVVTFDNTLKLPVVTGGTVPNDAELSSVVPGNLVFVARWNTDTNVDLGMLGPTIVGGGGEYVFPVLGLNRTPLGGHILFDHRGGPNGGYEVITYPDNGFPAPGHYTITATNQGTLDTTVIFNAFIIDPRTNQRVPQLFGRAFSIGQPQPEMDLPGGNTRGVIAEVTRNPPNGTYFNRFGASPLAAPSSSAPIAPASAVARPSIAGPARPGR
jgi:hypothetical protein